MKRIVFGSVALAALALGRPFAHPLPVSAAPQAPTFTLQGVSTVAVNGNNSSYGQGLAARHVGGQLRLMQLTFVSPGVFNLCEFVPPAIGATQTVCTRTWALGASGAIQDFNSIWFEEGTKNRLWITSAANYTVVNENAWITTMTLNDDGSISNVKKVFLANVPRKRAYGTVQPSPRTPGKYVVGDGGYISGLFQGGNASLGKTMYEFDDPATVAAGSTLPVFTILDHAPADVARGLRKTSPLNYFDAVSLWNDPKTPPPTAPPAGSPWLSPNAQGLGWQTHTDSYFATGMNIGTQFLAILSAGCGKVWYAASDLHSERRCYELHAWDNATLTGANKQQPPASMTELVLPGRGAGKDGSEPFMNVSGATFADGLIWFSSCGGDGTIYQHACQVGRLASSGTTTPPPPTPVNCAGTWSAPTVMTSACVNGQQTVTSSRAFTPTTLPSGGGQACPASPGVTTTVQACAPPPPVSLPVATMTVRTCTLVLSSATAPDGTGGWGVQYTRNGEPHGTRDTTPPFERSATVTAGSYQLAAIWSKPNTPPLTQALGTRDCR